MKKQKITVIRGIAGSGKTTLANKIAQETGAVVVEADDFYTHNGVYKYDNNLIKQAHIYCDVLIRKYLHHGCDVIVSNTSLASWQVEKLIQTAWEVVPNIDVEVLRTTSEYKSVHNVPNTVIEQMKARFQDYPGEQFV